MDVLALKCSGEGRLLTAQETPAGQKLCKSTPQAGGLAAPLVSMLPLYTASTGTFYKSP